MTSSEAPQGEYRPERERHVPVLLREAIELLRVRPEGIYIDATLGFGGHASAIVKALGPDGKLIGFDRDPEAFALAGQRLQALCEEMGERAPKLDLHNVEFSQLGAVAGFETSEGRLAEASVDGILADFGTSSMHFDQAHRGFSFQADGPLDMRMNPRGGVTAEQVVNQADENDLANLIYEFGEERRSRRIARAIVRARPIHTTAQLAEVVKAAAPPMNYGGIHPATRTFQAIRIHVNQELTEISSLLAVAPRLLRPGGRLVVISFHSLEDRLAKDAMRAGAAEGVWEMITRKPLVAEQAEIDRNPRARSAKLRAVQKSAGAPAGKSQGGKQSWNWKNRYRP